MKNINFFTEPPLKFVLKEKTKIRQWLKYLAKSEKYSIQNINYIFCCDDYLHEINVKYLNHDTYTDIITFDQSETEKQIEADIFISLERVKENAKTFSISYYDELHRILAHGLLHLCGFSDKTKTNKLKMSRKEDFYLKHLNKNLL